MLISEPLIYHVLEQTYFDLLFYMQYHYKICKHTQTAGLDMNYYKLIKIYISIPYWAIDSPFGCQLIVPFPQGTSLFGTRIMVSFEGLSIATFIIIRALGFWPWGKSLSLECSSLIRCTFILTLIACGGISNFITHLASGFTHCHNINLFLLYLVPSRMGTTYDLGVFSPHVDIIIGDCLGLTFSFFYQIECCCDLLSSMFAIVYIFIYEVTEVI